MKSIPLLNRPEFEPDPVLIFILKSAVALVAVVANAAVIAAVATTRKLWRTPNNIFICSLAGVDILVGVFAMPSDIFGWTIKLKCWTPLNMEGEVVFMLGNYLVTASCWMLSLISYDRLRYVRDSKNYASWMTRQRLTIFIIAGWLLPACMIGAEILFFAFSPVEAAELFDWAILAVEYCVPLIIIAINYIRLLVFTQKGTRAMAVIKKKCHAGVPEQLGVIQRTTYIISLLICACYVLHLPSFIYLEYTRAVHVIDCQVVGVLKWLYYTNSAINPLIYTGFNKDFRAAIARVIVCKHFNHRIPSLTTERLCTDYERAIRRSILQQERQADINNISIGAHFAGGESDEANNETIFNDDLLNTQINSIRKSVRVSHSVGNRLGYHLDKQNKTNNG